MGMILFERIDLLVLWIIRWPVFWRFCASGPCMLLPTKGLPAAPLPPVFEPPIIILEEGSSPPTIIA